MGVYLLDHRVHAASARKFRWADRVRGIRHLVPNHIQITLLFPSVRPTATWIYVVEFAERNPDFPTRFNYELQSATVDGEPSAGAAGTRIIPLDASTYQLALDDPDFLIHFVGNPNLGGGPPESPTNWTPDAETAETDATIIDITVIDRLYPPL